MKRTVLNRNSRCPKSKLAAIVPQRFPLVMVEWLDSCDIAGWKRLDFWKGVHTLQCVSVGFLIGEDAQSKTVSPHLAYPDDEANTSGSGIMIIPARAITRLTVLATADGAAAGRSSGRRESEALERHASRQRAGFKGKPTPPHANTREAEHE